MIRFKQLIGLFVLGILHLGCDADQLREKRITKARLRRQGDLNEWRILSSKKVSASKKFSLQDPSIVVSQ